MNRKVVDWLRAYAVAAVIFAVIDVVWIALVVLRQYQSQLGDLLASSPNPVGGILFYLLFVAGMVHFGIRPLDKETTVGKRVLSGALYGFFTYCTWALTALAVLRDFPVLVAVTDIAWGTGVCGLVTWLTVKVLGRRLRSR
ncbi:DUF2177 family protein [Paenarthrobacter ilicis]|uniref:Membrane protein n=1 Tax=Paenarthrobacter ilicis TaxID=43665 RepID=A0ABX0TD57_9MICC|nr:DUF2177 family protein [Paenarthrobacter ilicis]MBM7794229.1 putative membrane protein [Paenarthrobacter ilicis]NIJ00409.1 putative membrane protein [Paenarthrobacter ilicis]